MMTTTPVEDRLAGIRRQIEGLQERVGAAAADAKPRLQRHLDALQQEESSARTAVRDASDEIEDKLARLETRVDVARRSLAADAAESRAEFAAAVAHELHGWDAYVERLQMKAAARAGNGRERAEAALAELRTRRVAVGEQLGQLQAASGDAWREQTTRLAAAREEFERKVDELSTKLR
ncbi:MAG TPA: hypothetical protein VFA66_06665 [Gaiellaceae bacterium]|nr:hypothetical protein [Gaiellaceae bacterium]